MPNEIKRCKKWIEAALEYSGGTHAFEDVADGINKGVMQLWPTPRSGRFGWKKPLKAHGWEAQHASYVKEFA